MSDGTVVKEVFAGNGVSFMIDTDDRLMSCGKKGINGTKKEVDRPSIVPFFKNIRVT